MHKVCCIILCNTIGNRNSNFRLLGNEAQRTEHEFRMIHWAKSNLTKYTNLKIEKKEVKNELKNALLLSVTPGMSNMKTENAHTTHIHTHLI